MGYNRAEAGRWEALESLYHAALAIEPGRRSMFLNSACAGDSGLRREVECLIGFAEYKGPEPNAPVACASRLNAGMVLSGRFLIVRRIGGGGMGEVFEATDLELGDQVALKVIRPEVIERADMPPRFRREVQSAKKIAHPNICRVHDLHRHEPETGREPEVIFLTMELLRGETLRERLQRDAMPLDEARNLTEQLCAALEAAHRAGVIHCDFKSENVMLCPMPDGSTRAVVTDFGLARGGLDGSGSASITRAGQLIGTPAYMAPEQLLGEPVTPAVDIYALGLVLYEMVTGTQPFTGDSAFVIATQRLSSPPPPPGGRRPGLPPQWDTAILACLEYYPAKRFRSAFDVWKAISEEPETRDGHARTAHRLSRVALWAITGAALVLVTATLIWRSPQRPGQAHGAPSDNIYLAILPLRTPAGDDTLRYRTDGIADDLTARLFPFHDLHLASRSAVDGVKDQSLAKAARNLGVTMVVGGSLEKAGEDGAVTAIVSLEDMRSQKLVWTERFAGNTSDLLTLEDQISTRLIRALNVSPKTDQAARAAAHPTENAQAYDLYLKGRGLVRRRRDETTVKAAMGLYDAAIAKDARFGLAYASLADACTFMYDLKKDGFWLEKAVHEATEAVRWSPDAPESHTAMGSAWRATGRTNEAIAELKKALDLAPGSDEAYRRLASAYSDSGNKDEAIRYYRKAIEANPYYWMNFNQLGRAYLSLGRYSEAMESYVKVTEIAPEIPAGFINVAAILMHQGQYRKAIEPLSRAIQLSPTALAYANLAACYYDLGEYQKAVESGERAVALDPNNDLPAGNLADAYRRSGEAEKAKAAYRRAIQLAYSSLQANPRNSGVMGRLALYYAKQRQFGAARQFIERARGMDPADVGFLYDTAVIESMAGDRRAALRDLGLAVQKGYATAEIETDPDLSELRQTPEYRALTAKWRAARH